MAVVWRFLYCSPTPKSMDARLKWAQWSYCSWRRNITRMPARPAKLRVRVVGQVLVWHSERIVVEEAAVQHSKAHLTSFENEYAVQEANSIPLVKSTCSLVDSVGTYPGIYDITTKPRLSGVYGQCGPSHFLASRMIYLNLINRRCRL